MIGPIDGRGNFLDRFPRLQALQDFVNRNPVAPTGESLSQTGRLSPVGGGSAVNMANQVSPLLQAIGGGAQNDQLLQLLITLLILATMLQESQNSQSAADSLLSGLGRGQLLHSYQSISITTTQITWQTQYTTGAADSANSQPNLDTSA